jgi:hypothetical protein
MRHTPGGICAKLFAASGDQAASEHEQLAFAAIPVTSEKIYWLRVDTQVSVASQQIVFPAILGLARVAQCNKIRKPWLVWGTPRTSPHNQRSESVGSAEEARVKKNSAPVEGSESLT